MTKQNMSKSRVGDKNHQWKNISTNDIVAMRGKGMSIKKIAAEMRISISTVKRKLASVRGM